MVQNVINIGEKEDRVLNIVKAVYGLKTKSEAVALVTKVYGDTFLEPELRPKYVEKLKRIEKEGRFLSFNSIEELRESIENA